MKRPNLEEIYSYCLSRQNDVDAVSFYNHYESNGWMVGRTPMKNWKAAVHTWERMRDRFKGAGNGNAEFQTTAERIEAGNRAAFERARQDRLGPGPNGNAHRTLDGDRENKPVALRLKGLFD